MNRQHGFTLIEILIVLSLLTVLLVLVGTLIIGVNRSLVKVEVFGARLDELRAAQQYLRGSISQALPIAVAGDGPTVRFAGDTSSVVFFAPLPDSVGGGLFQQHISFSDQRLVAKFARLQVDELQAVGESQVLIKDVESFSFSFRGTSPQGKDSGWQGTWPWPERLPREVRIDARLGGPVSWVTQSVRLRLDLGSGSLSQ